MTLAASGDLVAAAVDAGSAVPAFNVITLEHAEAITRGAEQAGVAAILQLSENAIGYRIGLVAPIAAACRELAASASVPLAVHLDHLQDERMSRSAIADAARLGISSLMVDAAHLDYDDNVALTAELTREAHRAGLWVEAELGEVGGKDGAHAPGVRTDPAEAEVFVRDTDVDALAVAVGSSHAMTSRDARLDIDLIGRLADRLTVPLVLHGSSGVPDAVIREAVTAGIRKVNVGTGLNVALTAQVRAALADERLTDPRKYLAGGRDAMTETVARFCAVIAG